MSDFGEVLELSQGTVDGVMIAVRLSWPSAISPPPPPLSEELSPSQSIAFEADQATRVRIQQEGHRVLAEAYAVVREGLLAGACVLLEGELKKCDQARAAE